MKPQNGNADKIRTFIKQVGWATITNICYLMDGSYSPERYQKWKKFLYRMETTKRTYDRVRRIGNFGEVAFTIDLNYLPYKLFKHNSYLRNCLAKFIHDYPDFKCKIKNDKSADALVFNDYEKFYIEMDMGGENGGGKVEGELDKKFTENYSDQGCYRVIYFMASRYSQDTEQNRLNKLFEILKKIKYRKPGRILAACYTLYLNNGIIYNRHQEAVKI